MAERKPVGYFYIRYSTLSQGIEGKDSNRRQRESIIRLAKQYDLEIKEENFFKDEGISAYSGKNLKKGSKLREIVDQIDSLTIKSGDFLVVESIDRLSRRRLSEITDLVNGILKRGINILTTIDQKLYTPASVDILTDQIMISLIATRSNEESRVKAERVKQANATKRRLLEEGKNITRKGNLPYGIYLNEDTNTYAIDSEKQEEVKYLFHLLKTIGVIESANRVKQKFPKSTLTPAKARFMLDSKCVIGYYHAQTRENGKKVHFKYIPDVYPKMIKTSEFNGVLLAMEQRKTNPQLTGRREKYDLNIFKGIINCGCCNSNMIFEKAVSNHNKLDIYYYNCKLRKEEKACINERPRFDHVFASFMHLVFKSKSDIQTFRREGKTYKISYRDIPRVRITKKKLFKKLLRTPYRLKLEGDYFYTAILKSSYYSAKSLLDYYKDSGNENYLQQLVSKPEYIEALNYYNNKINKDGALLQASEETFIKAYSEILIKICEVTDNVNAQNLKDMKIETMEELSLLADAILTTEKKDEYLKLVSEIYSDKLEKELKSSLLSLFRTEDVYTYSDEMEKLISDLEKANTNLVNLKNKLNVFLEQGLDFSDELILNIKKFEVIKKEKEEAIETLKKQAKAKKKLIDINDNKQFLSLFRTMEGRLKINEYLKSKGIFFNVRQYKEIRALEIEIKIKTKKDGEILIGYHFNVFPLKFPLREFLGKNIGTIRDLIDDEEREEVILRKQPLALLN